MPILSYSLRKQGNGDELLAEAAKALGTEAKARRAYKMALNQTGRDARVATIRALTKQVGLKKGQLVAHGGIREDKASSGNLTWALKSTGRALPLHLFGAKQYSYGVRASPWGRAQRFPGAFINAGTWRSGNPVHGGHVLHRAGKKIILDDGLGIADWDGKKFQPYRIMYGPSIPAEMVRDESARAFEAASAKLPTYVAKIVEKMTKGVIK